MSRSALLIFAAALTTVGCSHQTTKPDAASTPVAKSEAAKSAEKMPAKTTESNGTKVECSVKGDERILEVRTKDKGCELIYTKAGNEGSVASSMHGTEYCQKALDKMREKLKGAGYECK